MSFVAVVMVVGLIGAVLIVGLGGGSNNSASTTTLAATTTIAASTTTLPSVKGKPCVAMSGTLPKGAPSVPVQTGPPPTKLVTKDLKVGTGAVVKATQTVTVDYIGVACSTGKIFDSSYASGQPATFTLDQVITGWSQGIVGMHVGGERLLGIPSDLAYGSSGAGADIAPDEALWFVVTVHSAK